MRNAETLNTVIGHKEDGTVVIVEEFFDYGGGFKGFTGTEVVPVYTEDITEALNDIEDWYEEVWREAVRLGETRAGLTEFVEDLDEEEYLEHRFESFGKISTRDIAKDAGLDEPERYAFSSCGRIFPRALEGMTVIPGMEDLVQRIREVEIHYS